VGAPELGERPLDRQRVDLDAQLLRDGLRDRRGSPSPVASPPHGGRDGIRAVRAVALEV
jgi:hypothetical protein